MNYYVYILLCADNTFYCGYSTNLEKRLIHHNEGKRGAKYTKSRRPVSLIYSERFSSLSEALKREYEIKNLTKREKSELVAARSTSSQG